MVATIAVMLWTVLTVPSAILTGVVHDAVQSPGYTRRNLTIGTVAIVARRSAKGSRTTYARVTATGEGLGPIVYVTYDTTVHAGQRVDAWVMNEPAQHFVLNGTDVRVLYDEDYRAYARSPLGAWAFASTPACILVALAIFVYRRRRSIRQDPHADQTSSPMARPRPDPLR